MAERKLGQVLFVIMGTQRATAPWLDLWVFMRRGLLPRIGRPHQGKWYSGPVTRGLAEPLLVEFKEKWGIEMVKTLA
jgi:hypothetical protein